MPQTSDPHFYICEDDYEVSNNYFKHLNLRFLIPEYTYISNFDELSNALIDNLAISVFWVDMNFGQGRTHEGLEMIKLIRVRCPEALIVVYTAYSYLKKDCMDAGADFFYVKQNYRETIDNIRENIMDYLKKNVPDLVIAEYYADISHIDIDNDIVMLNCYIKPENEAISVDENSNNIIEWEVAKNNFSAIEDLNINTKVKVTIYRQYGGYSVIFGEVQQIPVENKIEELFDNKIDDDEILSSDFWIN